MPHASGTCIPYCIPFFPSLPPFVSPLTYIWDEDGYKESVLSFRAASSTLSHALRRFTVSHARLTHLTCCWLSPAALVTPLDTFVTALLFSFSSRRYFWRFRCLSLRCSERCASVACIVLSLSFLPYATQHHFFRVPTDGALMCVLIRTCYSISSNIASV